MPGAARPAVDVGYKGSVTANGQTIEGTVDAEVADRPSITADLKTSLLDLDKIGGTATCGAGARATGGGSGGAAAIDTRQCVPRCPVAGCRHPGKLAVAHLQRRPRRDAQGWRAHHLALGGLYGGALELSGTVNGSQPGHLSFDFKGDANGIYVGEMLRSTRQAPTSSAARSRSPWTAG
jgi:hypothetical protein